MICCGNLRQARLGRKRKKERVKGKKSANTAVHNPREDEDGVFIVEERRLRCDFVFVLLAHVNALLARRLL